jgi:phosphoribosyl-AMP cyclohydrolase / phosphoribosyl-ATP pyrophosphohydrolase
MIDVNKLNFDKNTALIPCIIQDNQTFQVLMLGYMNKESLSKTLESLKVTFYSRSKKRLWTKGEESGNFLNLVSIEFDCDSDAILCMVEPVGPTCHTGNKTCWNNQAQASYGVLKNIENTIISRFELEPENSYISGLKKKGINKIAQKVGEEAVEVVIEALGNNQELLLEESADLLFHFMILLKAKNLQLEDVIQVLKKRQR